MRPSYLYVHVPFCARRCSYCDFAVQATREPPVDAWLDAIEAELLGRARAHDWALPLELRTIYIGGGTPSLLGTGALGEFRDRLRRHAAWSDDRVEWTAEANPESFTAELARDWRAVGINRISLGAQSFDPEALRWMGRLHGPDGPARAVRAARDAGIGQVSIDLIFGLPSRLGRDWTADLDRALALDPDHISLYGLTAEPRTPLGRWVREGRERMPDEEAYEAEYLEAAERLTAEGFVHYEVSNFARPGCESRHNSAYWTGAAYLGLGAGAHSFAAPVRWWNLRDWAAYRDAVESEGSAVEASERVEGDAARLERTWLGLRTRAGLALEDLRGAQVERIRLWRERGWAVVEDGRVRLTAAGWLLLDRLAVDLDDAAPPLDAALAAPSHSGGTLYSEAGQDRE